MSKRTGPTNPQLKELITELKELAGREKVKLWARVAHDLEKPTRKRREANISKINKHIKASEIALVPGKVLGMGQLDKKLIVAGFKFSKEAKEKIDKAGGKAISIDELMKENPKGKKIRIIG